VSLRNTSDCPPFFLQGISDILCTHMDCSQGNEADVVAPPPYSLVSTSECFHEMLERLSSAPRLAIDIEADSLYHYFEKVCLIQISSDNDTYILDTLVIKEIGELAPLMANSSIEKVFHAASYDFYCLHRDYDFAFENIFDTHIAAQLLGYEFLGLSALMEELLGIHHSKRRQRDDWSRRPLVSEQLEYAAMDTHHLLSLRDMLDLNLREKGRLSWAQEEFETAAATQRPEKEFDAEGYRRIKGSRELPPQEQAALQALYILRDQMARKLDVPPFKVLNNSVLLDLVHRPPHSPHEMFSRRGISYRVARKFAAEILQTLADARLKDPSISTAHPRHDGKPPSRAARRRMEALKIWRQEKAKTLGLQVGVIFPGNLLENLAEVPPADKEELANLPGMRRWRAREFGEEVLHLLHNSDHKAEPTGA
jgi:ribonuclease D